MMEIPAYAGMTVSGGIVLLSSQPLTSGLRTINDVVSCLACGYCLKASMTAATVAIFHHCVAGSYLVVSYSAWCFPSAPVDCGSSPQ